MLIRENKLCQNTTFVDVDYTALIQKKCDIIKQTPELRNLLNEVTAKTKPENVLFRSQQYVAIGCDLRKIEKLDQLLKAELNIESCTILFLAEVSLTYVDKQSADALIRYGATLGDGK